MQVDLETLADLGLSRVSWGASDPLAVFDHCWSQGGRTALENLIRHPLGCQADIEDRQRFLQAITRLLPSLPTRDLGPLIERVEGYLGSTYIELPRRAALVWVVRRRYPEVVGKLIDGLLATAHLLSFSRRVADRLRSCSESSRQLQELERRLRACVDSPDFVRLAAYTARAGHRLRIGTLDDPIRAQGRPLLQALVDALHRLDALQSLARLGARPGFVYPTFVENASPCIALRGLFHPMLAKAVDNDVTVADGTCLIFLTGPNMAGKSTLLRAIGLAVLLAHVGAAIPASEGRLTVLNRLFAALTARDSLVRGESYFLAEVRRVGELLRHLEGGDNVLALLDEMFKGTNVLDASDATELVVTSLAKYGRGAFIVSSHLAELAGRLTSIPSVRLLCMPVSLEDGDPRFSFRVAAGVSHQRLGMLLLERTGVARALRQLVESQTIEIAK